MNPMAKTGPSAAPGVAGADKLRWQVPFFSIWTGQAFSLLGSKLVQFALVWWLTGSTNSATVLALASMMALLPRVFLSPFAGALIDRWNRRVVTQRGLRYRYGGPDMGFLKLAAGSGRCRHRCFSRLTHRL